MNVFKIRRRQKFTRRCREVANERLASGEMSHGEHGKLMSRLADYRIMDQVVNQIETDKDAWGDFDWAKMWQWIKDHWMEIAKLILSLVVMFAEEDETE